MIEIHPFKPFVPKKAKYLILGSFVGRNNTYPKGHRDSEAWFYGAKRNQFWTILEKAYGVKLEGKKDKQKLLTKLKVAITDIILSCERSSQSNLDIHLSNITFNTKTIGEILKHHSIQKIYFTSRFVEKNFKRYFSFIIKKFPHPSLVLLPAPSPRHTLPIQTKGRIYKSLLPR